MEIHLTPFDRLIVIGYFLILLIIGFRSRTKSGMEEFFLAGRSLTIPAFVATLVSSWYGGILGIGEFIYRYGILNWFAMGLPYYIFALLFAVFIAGRIREKKFITIPDLIFSDYGNLPGLLSSFLTFILVTPAPYYFMIASLVSVIFRIPFWSGFLAGALVSTIYIFKGGLRSVVKTDIFQFLLMFAGFILIFILCVVKLGGFSFLRDNLPPAHLSPLGGQKFSFLLVWFFIALWTLVEPNFYQRCYAAKSPSVAQKGIVISILFWMLFDFLTLSTGLYARAYFPNIEPSLSYIYLGDVILPAVLKGVFIVSILATIMSTLDSLSFVSAITFSRDIVWRLNPRLNEDNTTGLSKIGILFTIILSAVLIRFFPSVVNIWYTVGTLVIPSLLFPVVATLFGRGFFSRTGVIIHLISPFCISLGWLIYGYNNSGYPLGIEPFFAGLGVSVIIVIFDRVAHKNGNLRG